MHQILWLLYIATIFLNLNAQFKKWFKKRIKFISNVILLLLYFLDITRDHGVLIFIKVLVFIKA